MGKYYITFGEEGHAFVGGWVEVEANSPYEAVSLFHMVHPAETRGGNFCAIYQEVEFKQTRMYAQGSNHGAGCHEIISLSVRKP